MKTSRGWFLSGLFFTTFSTLAIEIINTRLLSVSTWYHLSFFAVSTAMLGMAAGAVRVYLGENLVDSDAAQRALARYATLFALSIPVTNTLCLCIPIQPGSGLPTIIATAVTTLILAVPFYLSGIVVAIALTRIPGPSGLVYAVDLLGAALGSIGVLLLFEFSNITSAMLAVGSVAAVGAGCFYRSAGARGILSRFILAAALLAIAFVNNNTDDGLRTMYAKGEFQNPNLIEYEYWTIHGQVAVNASSERSPFYWAKARKAEDVKLERRRIRIDGAAGTSMTEWEGSSKGLEWVKDDITALPYHLRKGGNNVVIGVGGGRDILTALWGRSKSVTGIEINEAFLHLLKGPLRQYAGIEGDPRVVLVHDEARSFLTRTPDRYNIIQMSLIDTWAATGAGAFTLSENGLYTLEAWKTILEKLTPGGLFSVSRWYSKEHISETSRLVALATAALLEIGANNPQRHMILASRRRVATLIISSQPLKSSDVEALRGVEDHFGLEILLAPEHESPAELLAPIVQCRSLEEIEAEVENPRYDFSPPTDERPYFFNILKLGSFVLDKTSRAAGKVTQGNMLATLTLGLLWMVVFLLVITTILGPLIRFGLPGMRASDFALAVLYFALIGMGFMFVQIPLMQRFSVYLGHPIYSLAVILFSMILATGVGSFFSDRLDIDTRSLWVYLIPVVIAANILLWTLGIQSIIDRTIMLGLLQRICLTVAVVSIAALPLGLCFPVGLRLVRRISDDATPWMWGVNGAAGVLASVSAVAVSIWSGISTSLYMAIAAYMLLLLPAALLWRRGRRS